METEKLFKAIKPYPLKEQIGMILSAHADYGSEVGAMISVKQFDLVADDLIRLFESIK